MMHLMSALLIISTAICGIIDDDISVYGWNGALVVEFWKPCFQLNGMIFGGLSAHEYGHYVQQKEMGNGLYYVSIVAPSVLTNILTIPLGGIGPTIYRNIPWEKNATNVGVISFGNYGFDATEYRTHWTLFDGLTYDAELKKRR